jgi:glycosyltransferase involved in cell wall biosynthesis
MKILLISNYVLDKQESMLRFTDVLEKSLKKFGHDVRIVRPEPVFGKLKPSAQGIGKWLGYVDKYVLFPAKLKKTKDWADVIHIIDHANSVYIRLVNKKPHIITCCDFLAIRSALGELKENHTKITGKILQHVILNGIKKGKRFACISEHTMDDLIRIAKIDPKNASVIYMGQNYRYSPMKKSSALNRLKKFGVDFQFFIHVGNNNWYKNRIGAIRIFEELIRKPEFSHYNLVMVGKSFTNGMKDFIFRSGLNNRVIELVGVADEDLRALYSSAAALIFPSSQEGFGWPIAEAQACGCPVFTTNRAPMTEVGGNAAVYFDPENPKKAAEIIAQNFGKVKQMKKKGLINVKRFSTEKMIRKYIELYKKIKYENS